MALTKEQVELRRTRIGSSEVGALLGIDPYKTALDVYADRVLEREPDEDDHRSWGLDVEGAILANHARREGLTLIDPRGTLVHPMLPVCCTPDGIGERANGRLVDIQAKNVNRHNAHEWGEPGTDDAPLLYVAQVTIELGVLRAMDPYVLSPVEETAHLVAAIAGDPPACYPIVFDPDLFGTLADVAAKFACDCLIPQHPPRGWEQDRSALEYVKRRFRKSDGRLLPPTDEARALTLLVAELRAAGKVAKERLERAEAQLYALIGDAEGFDGLCRWSEQPAVRVEAFERKGHRKLFIDRKFKAAPAKSAPALPAANE